MTIRFNLLHASAASALFLTAELSSCGVAVAFAPASFFSAFCNPAATTTTMTMTTTIPTSTSIARRQQRRYHSSLNPDWDNNDFLSSLGQSTDSINEANLKYYKQKENRAAMDAWRTKQLQQQQQTPPPSTSMQQDEQQKYNGPSPEFFKKMGLGEGQVPQPPTRQFQTPPPKQQQQLLLQSPLPPQSPQFYDANGNPVTMPMVYDAYGNLVPFHPVIPAVAQPLAGNPQPQPIIAYDGPPLPPKTKAAPDKPPAPAGYNPDAFTMSNTADVYFAQLKQDSKVRKLARMSGDIDRANRVFADESVKQIGDSWNGNPYTKEKNIAEARAELEGAVRMQVAGEFYESSDSNSSSSTFASSANRYKMKLEQRKAARQQSAKVGAANPPTVQSPVNEILSVPVQPVAAASNVESEKSKDIPTFQSNAGMISSPAPAPVGMSAPSFAASAGRTFAPATAPPSVVSDDEENVRRSIRTLQGLLLKHRGGPGFGAGRLKAPEAQRLEDTLENVKSILRAEVGGHSAATSGPAPTTVLQVESTPAATQPIVPPPAPVSLPAPSAPVSAVAPPSMTNDPLAGSVACVEAVLKMYKESTPAEREAMILPMREAFMAAASASNKYIAESELSAHRAAMEAGPAATLTSIANNSPASSIMGFPTTYAVTKPQVEVEAERAMFADSTGGQATENERKLEQVYNALLRAKGDGGKLGLKNISGDEANDLADKLVMMRGVLLDELNK